MSINIDDANEGLRQHARGGIAAVITVNSGAMIALLSQLGALQDLVNMFDVKHAFGFWIAGVVIGLFCWLFATLAASAHVRGRDKAESFYTAVGYLAWLFSVACFAFGATWVLYSFK